MLRESTIRFLHSLHTNNNKSWFDEHRDDYAQARENFEELVTGLLAGLGNAEPLFREQKAKDCIFRIFRDVRFSNDKTPYKDHFGAFFSKGGRKYMGAGYYLHLQPGGKSFAGGGLWVPEPKLLKVVRQEIDYNFDEFKTIIANKKFSALFGRVSGEQLKTTPKGYTEDNPALEYLRMKSFTVSHNLDDKDIAGKQLVKKVLEVFDTMQPFIQFLNRAVESEL